MRRIFLASPNVPSMSITQQLSSISAAEHPTNLSRRRFAQAVGLFVAAPALLLPKRTLANTPPRTLSFDHTHTGEKLTVTYGEGDQYVPAALLAVNHFLRDFRTGDMHNIDPQLLDRLHMLSSITRSRAPFQVISGYRSPATNGEMHAKSNGVASHSLHMEGKAIDIRLADVALTDVRDAALSLRAGGVGYYPGSNFVHVDTGRVRRW